MTATPTKLRSGEWGARVSGTVRKGDEITITARSGKSWTATVAAIVWQGEDVAIVATASTDRPARGSTTRRGRRTGCSCGSREDENGDLIDARNNCKQCEFDAYDC